MDNAGIEKLITSPFETDRIKVIYYAVKNKRTDLYSLIKKTAAEDESVNVRYYAQKACELFDEIDKEQAREKELEAEIDKKKSGQAAIRKRIFELLDSQAPEDRILAARAAVKTHIGSFIDAILKKIETETDDAVLSAFIKAVGHSGDKSYTPILLKYLKHPNTEIVLSAIEAFASLEDVRAFPYVISVLHANMAENETITAAITGYLAGFAPEKIHLFLVEMLGYPSENMVEAALNAICAFRCKKSAEAIAKLTSHRNDAIASRARRALAELETSGRDDFDYSVFIENLIASFDEAPGGAPGSKNGSDDTAVKESEKKIDELRELIRASSPAAEARIVELLKTETDPRVLGYAISACRAVPGARNLTTLKKFLSHPDDRIRANAIEVLGETEGIDLHGLLKPFLSDENNRVRANAIIALRNYPDVDHCALLKEMINDKNNRLMVISAIYAIMQIKGDTVELLRPLAKDRNEEIKVRAVSALEFLAGDAKNMTARNILGELSGEKRKGKHAAAYIFNKSTMGGGAIKKSGAPKMSVSAPAAGVYLVNRLALLFRAFVHVVLVVALGAAAFGVYREFNSTAPKSAVNPVGVIASVFKKNAEDFKIILLYTANLEEAIGESAPDAAAKKTKLKDIIARERESAAKDSSVFLLFDLGNHCASKISPSDNTESVYEFLNEAGYDAASFAARDALFCFNLLSARGEKFKLPVISCNLIHNSTGETPAIFRTSFEKKVGGLTVAVLAVTDRELGSKLPSNLAASYGVKDPIASVAGLFKKNADGCGPVLTVLLSSNTGGSGEELAMKKIGADIIIDMGHGPQTSMLTSYKKVHETFVLPSKIKKGAASLGRFEFIYESASKSVGDACKWRLNEL